MPVIWRPISLEVERIGFPRLGAPKKIVDRDRTPERPGASWIVELLGFALSAGRFLYVNLAPARRGDVALDDLARGRRLELGAVVAPEVTLRRVLIAGGLLRRFGYGSPDHRRAENGDAAHDIHNVSQQEATREPRRQVFQFHGIHLA